jgi:acetylornithine deacetylase/succinyl-diaminopimelate desuccinylase-like protein
MNPESPFGLAARRALETAFGRPPALLREGGSIPILLEFQKVLGVDCLLLALASPDCNAHSPNESFPLENFAAGIRLCGHALREIAAAADAKEYTGDVPAEAIVRNRTVC